MNQKQIGQHWEWLLHDLPDLFQKLTRNIEQVDFEYALVKFEDGKGIIGLHR